MPSLLEAQRAICRGIVEADDSAALALIARGGIAPAARLGIYRNTYIATLTKALRLSFPAIERLVGAPFFESAAHLYMEQDPPRTAYLDLYGAGFPGFLARYPAAAGVPYLGDVARLEWAVSSALHATDAAPLDPQSLSAVEPHDRGDMRLIPHPSVGLVPSVFPIDAIWSAVLSEDEAAPDAIDLDAGPVWLLVERRREDVEVTRLDEPEWRFLNALCAGQTLQNAIDRASEIDVPAQLADHLASGLFAGFEVSGCGASAKKESLT